MNCSKETASDQSSQPGQLPSKRKLSFSRRTGDAHSQVFGPELHTAPVATSELTTQPKRRKIVGPALVSSVGGDMHKEFGQAVHPDVVYGSKGFQPHTGIRRLVIKNLRNTPRENLAGHYKQILANLSDAVATIYAGRQPSQPRERLYRDVEDTCRDGRAEQLFQFLKSESNSYLQNSLLPDVLNQGLATASGIDALRTVHNAWQKWSSQILQIRSIFSFLDRSFLLGSKSYPQINDMAIMLFREVICENRQFGTQIYLGICELVNVDRSGRNDRFDTTLLRESVMMLHVMDLYKTGFEPVFLMSSKVFFEEFHHKSWASFDLKTYVFNCVKLFDKEGARCDTYNLDSATKRALLTDARKVFLEKQATRLIDTNGISGLLEENEVDSLKSLYTLLKSSHLEDRLKDPWEDYIKKTGAAIISDPERSSDIVVRLLELKRSLEMIVRDAFDRDESFRFALREAYSGFINDRRNSSAWGTGNSKVGEVVAKYVDLLLRGGLKAVPRSLTSDAVDRDEAEKRGDANTGDEDAELDRQLEQGIELFRFIEGKDVFEAFYKKDLARRLLMGRSASQDAERNMLTKLKSECGSSFTHNLEQMFKDQEISHDEMVSYKQTIVNTGKASLDLQVSVLSAAAWPTSPDVKVNLPSEVARQIERYDKYYKSKHTGRRLVWKHALAHSIVRARFQKGPKELVVSGFQAIVLVLFNDIGDDGNLSYVDIKKATDLVDAELQRTLQSLACAKFRILNKHPRGRDINQTDTFTVNLAFSDPKYRVKINQIQLKETAEENKETHERVSLDRQYETQASIVRIMKSRKTMSHANLVAEVIDQTKSRGAVELGEIKKNIEKLIEKDYLEREGGSYTYLA